MARPKHSEKSKTYRIDLKPSEVKAVGGWASIKELIKKAVQSKQKLS